MSNFNVLVIEGRPHQVFIVGEIDIVTAPRVTDVLCDLRGDVAVDCTEITFIDSAGFEALDCGYRVATAGGSTFDVAGLQEFQARVAGLLRVPYLSSGPADG
jgi:anti-anti-sigma regulatory factor